MSGPRTATTIAAISSPPGSAERGVLRVSGPRARSLVLATWRGDSSAQFLDRRGFHRGRFHDGRGEQPQLLLWMPAPQSFTREDVAEMHLCGSPPLLGAALRRLLELGAEPAAPGEFTRRAFLSGRIDLTRAEGVLALVQARNEAERRAGTALLFGGLAQRVEELRTALLDLRALCEASLDFEEHDTGHIPRAEIELRCAEIASSVRRAASFEHDRAPRMRGLPRVVLFGARNAGKSSLFNALVGSESALVSDFPGTTRDALECEIDLGGRTCILCDTAGLDLEARGPDRRAQEFARSARESADLMLWVVDASRPPAAAPDDLGDPPLGCPRLLVWSKTDLTDHTPAPTLDPALDVLARVSTSSLRGIGIEELKREIAQVLSEPAVARGTGQGLGRELSIRHGLALERCSRELDVALAEARTGAPLELLAENFRAATSALDDITGETTPEAVLDRLFERFCLGK
jgi:tRNA modification GTPase